jgi:hypothetical protein
MSDLNAALGAVQPLLGPNASTVAIAATASSQNVALPQPPNSGGSPAANAASTFVVDNTGASGLYAFVAFGGSGVTATISNGATPGSYPCAPGKTVITVLGNPGYAAVIASGAGPTSIYITPANGKL